MNKYTNDGRKVVVLEELNVEETIVQEVFVSKEGVERPGGKRFAVRTAALHDEPPVSWKEKRIVEIDAAYAKATERDRAEERALVARREEVRTHMDYAGKLLKAASPASFDLLVRFLTGGVKWVVTKGYSPKVVEWRQGTYEGRVRLLTMFGRDDGTMSFTASRYCDGSDHGRGEEIVPCDTREEAVTRWLQEVGDRANDETIALAGEYGVELPAEAVARWRAKKVANAEQVIERAKQTIAAHEEIIARNR